MKCQYFYGSPTVKLIRTSLPFRNLFPLPWLNWSPLIRSWYFLYLPFSNQGKVLISGLNWIFFSLTTKWNPTNRTEVWTEAQLPPLFDWTQQKSVEWRGVAWRGVERRGVGWDESGEENNFHFITDKPICTNKVKLLVNISFRGWNEIKLFPDWKIYLCTLNKETNRAFSKILIFWRRKVKQLFNIS